MFSLAYGNMSKGLLLRKTGAKQLLIRMVDVKSAMIMTSSIGLMVRQVIRRRPERSVILE